MPESEGTFYPENTVLRIDDISLNIDYDQISDLLRLVREKYPTIRILLAVSPMVFQMEVQENNDFDQIKQRVFPKILNAYSDHRVYYKVDKIGVPGWFSDIVLKYKCDVASHGLIHVDHRLLDFGAQEMSILASASLVKSSIFVPPFNKFNANTETICKNNRIQLVRWEDGWNHLGYNEFMDNGGKYYMHFHDFSRTVLEKIFS
jgi:hypothetical protein